MKRTNHARFQHWFTIAHFLAANDSCINVIFSKKLRIVYALLHSFSSAKYFIPTFGSIIAINILFINQRVEALSTDHIDAVVAESGPVHLLVELEDFGGIELEVLWEKAKFAFAHLRDIERMAVVGDRAWEEWWVKIGGALAPAETRYFDHDDIDAARAWLRR